MAYKYSITVPELRLILSYLEIPGLHGFEDLPAYREDDKEDALTAAVSLEERGLLTDRYTDHPSLDHDLVVMINAAFKAARRFIISSEDLDRINRNIYYFDRDMILLFQLEDNNLSILWLPYIHIAIGGAASILEPYLNQQTDPALENCFSDYPEALQYCADRGYHPQTVFLQYDGNDPEKTAAYTCTDEHSQLFLEQKSDGIHLSCPGKADYINAIGQHLVLLHGKAMKEGGIDV